MSYLTSRKRTAYQFVGQRHLRYLKEYRRAAYITLIISSRLDDYLADIDKQAQERMGKTYRADETGAGCHGAVKIRKCLRMGTENE